MTYPVFTCTTWYFLPLSAVEFLSI